MADANVQIIIRTIDQTTKETKKIDGSLKALGKSLVKYGAMATAAGVAIKQAFDLGKQGAQITVTRQAFQGMGGDLEALSRAARGTMSEMDMMTSLNTLLAGTTAQVNKAFVENQERLMEIAKAAQSLNPSLGDTDYFFQSIGTGIKRNSPLILDNLGIVVKSGEAYQNYADQIGKTVSQLTAEEKSLAILYETMKAGENITRQAAGVDTSNLDSFSALGATLTDIFNSLKETLGNTLGPIAAWINEELNEAMETHEQLTKSEHQLALEAKTYADYRKTSNIYERQSADYTKQTASNVDYTSAVMGVQTQELEEQEILQGQISENEFNLLKVRQYQAEQWMKFNEAQKTAEDRRLAAENALTASRQAAAERAEERERLAEEHSEAVLGNYKELYDLLSGDLTGGFADAIFVTTRTPEQIGFAEGMESFLETLQSGIGELDMAGLDFGILEDFATEGFLIEVKTDLEDGTLGQWEAISKVADELNVKYSEAERLLKEQQTTLDYINGLEANAKLIIDVVMNGDYSALGLPPEMTPQASGGPLAPLALVGEQGPEMIINGTVIPAPMTRQLMALGLSPSMKFASGGNLPLIDGIYTPEQMYDMYYSTSSSAKKASDSLSYSPTYTSTSSSSTSETQAIASAIDEQTTQQAALGYQAQVNVNNVSSDTANRIETSNQRLADKIDELILKTLDEDGAGRAFRQAIRLGGT